MTKNWLCKLNWCDWGHSGLKMFSVMLWFIWSSVYSWLTDRNFWLSCIYFIISFEKIIIWSEGKFTNGFHNPMKLIFIYALILNQNKFIYRFDYKLIFAYFFQRFQILRLIKCSYNHKISLVLRINSLRIMSAVSNGLQIVIICLPLV